jgi:class 3 adenylate cyclase
MHSERIVSTMNEVKTIPAKYIFLDVVSFTHNRSVEAQSDIVQFLNEIVQASLAENELPREKLILLPTGDGLCMALLNIENPFDIHLLLALSIIRLIEEHNKSTDNEMRRFQVRIGLNANTDNLVTDINGNQNIAGAGINMAARVMGMADGNQILVGEAVFDILRYREKYMNSFKTFRATVKHGLQIPVYQLIDVESSGLNTTIPQAFQVPEKQEPKLSRTAAYYFAHAIKNRSFFVEMKDNLLAEAGTILLWFLAEDSKEKSRLTEIDEPHYKTYKAEGGNIKEQLDYYDSIDFQVLSYLATCIAASLSKYGDCFEGGVFEYRFITPKGVAKLKREWPSIWTEFGLDNHV